MRFQIHITRAAEQDLAEAADYIEFVLKNPDAADNLLDLVAEKIGVLAANPEICPVADDPVLKFWGIRFMKINNYLAFYTVDKKARWVYVVRFLYGKREWNSILKQLEGQKND